MASELKRRRRARLNPPTEAESCKLENEQHFHLLLE